MEEGCSAHEVVVVLAFLWHDHGYRKHVALRQICARMYIAPASISNEPTLGSQTDCSYQAQAQNVHKTCGTSPSLRAHVQISRIAGRDRVLFVPNTRVSSSVLPARPGPARCAAALSAELPLSIVSVLPPHMGERDRDYAQGRGLKGGGFGTSPHQPQQSLSHAPGARACRVAAPLWRSAALLPPPLRLACAS